MRDIKNNNTVTHKFSSDERVDTVEADKPTMYKTLTAEDDVVHLMEEETFEQIEMPIALLDKEQQRWLHDGMAVKVNKYEGQPLFVTRPHLARPLPSQSRRPPNRAKTSRPPSSTMARRFACQPTLRWGRGSSSTRRMARLARARMISV